MTADDELAVRNLIARLAQLADGGAVDDYIRCFTDDAHWDMPGAPRRGRADIAAGATERRATGQTGPGSATRHVVSTIAVRVDGASATATSYWQFYGETTTTPRLLLMGQYDDQFVRGPDGWRLASRHITFG